MKAWDAHRFTPEKNTPIWNNENKVNANHTQNLQASPENLPHGKNYERPIIARSKLKAQL